MEQCDSSKTLSTAFEPLKALSVCKDRRSFQGTVTHPETIMEVENGRWNTIQVQFLYKEVPGV